MRKRRPRALVGGVAAALAVMGLATVLPVAPPAGGVGPIAYPDLITVIPTGGFGITHPTATTKELDYTHIVYNAGAGPLEVVPTDYDPATNVATGVQRLYSYAADGSRTLAATKTATDQFFYHQAHGHYHFPLATFGLYGQKADGSLGTPIAVSPKNGFCLGDDVHLDATLPHSPPSNGFTGSTCTDPTAVRGISSGWGDRYDRADPGQAIDITGVPDGTYWFHSVVDPDNNFAESDKTNNTTDIKIRVNGDTVTPVSPLQSKGSFVFDTSALVDGVGTVSTPALTTTTSNELLVAFVSAMGSAQAATVTGAGLVWTRARRSNAQQGTAEVWSAKATTPLTNAKITSTLAAGANMQSLAVFAVRGASAIGATAGAGAATGLPNVALTTTKQGAWVMAVGNDPDRDVPHVSAVGRTMVQEVVDEAGGDSTFLEATAAPTVAAGTTIAFPHKYPPHDHWNMAAIELLPLATNDHTAPIISANTATNIAQDRATITWTTDEPATSRVDYGPTTGYGQSTTPDATLVTQHVQDVSGLTPSTHYVFRVVSADSQGNVASKGPVGFTTTAPRTTPPVFSNIRLADLQPDQVIIAWNTDEPTDTQVSYGVTTALGSLSPRETPLTTTHFQLITNLQPSTIYHYRVKGADPYGNSGVSADAVFHTPALPPPITVDKTVVKDGNGTQTTAPFSTSAAGELLVAFVSSDGLSNASQSFTVAGAGLTWTLDTRANGQSGDAEVWHAFAGAQLTGSSVTSTPTTPGFDQSLTVVAFAGASGTGAKIAMGQPSGAPHATLSTVGAQSVAYAVGEDYDIAVARTLAAGQSMVHQWIDSGPGDTLWVQRLIATTGAVDSSITLADTAPVNDRWNLAAVEIIRPISVPPPPATKPALSGVTANAITATGATITWTTDVIATGQVRYGKTAAYGGTTALAPVGVKVHSRALTGLQPSTTYHYVVVSANAVGATASADFTFTTPAS
jgi:hypothetical protein